MCFSFIKIVSGTPKTPKEMELVPSVSLKITLYGFPKSFKKLFAFFFLSLKFIPIKFRLSSLLNLIKIGCSFLHGKHHEAHILIKWYLSFDKSLFSKV